MHIDVKLDKTYSLAKLDRAQNFAKLDNTQTFAKLDKQLAKCVKLARIRA